MTLFIQIVGLLLLAMLGGSFIGATVKCYKKEQYGGFGLGFMLSFITLTVVAKLLMILLGM